MPPDKREAQGSDADSARFFDGLNHPLRVKILRILDRGPKTFSELKKAVGIESSGHLAFHLEKLGALVKENGEGKYVLSDDGREALWLAQSLKSSPDHALPDTRRRFELLRASPKIAIALGLLAIVVLGSLLLVLYYPNYPNPATGISPGTPESFSQVFGSNYQALNVSFSQLPVGTDITFDGVTFIRLPFAGLQGYTAGFTMEWTTKAGIGGGGTVPSQDGSYAYSQDPSSGMAAGYLVYPSQSFFKLVVKG